MNFMNNIFNMEQNKYYVCGEHIVHRVNNELFADGQLLYTFYTHDNMGNKYKKGPVGKLSRHNNMSLEQLGSLIVIIHEQGFQQVQ
jgi:hypothetical protein